MSTLPGRVLSGGDEEEEEKKQQQQQQQQWRRRWWLETRNQKEIQGSNGNEKARPKMLEWTIIVARFILAQWLIIGFALSCVVAYFVPCKSEKHIHLPLLSYFLAFPLHDLGAPICICFCFSNVVIPVEFLSKSIHLHLYWIYVLSPWSWGERGFKSKHSLTHYSPGIAAPNGTIKSQYTILYGAVAFIFLVSGLQLAPEKLRQNLTNWRLHIIVQGVSFLVIPAVMLGASVHFSILFSHPLFPLFPLTVAFNIPSMNQPPPFPF